MEPYDDSLEIKPIPLRNFANYIKPLRKHFGENNFQELQEYTNISAQILSTFLDDKKARIFFSDRELAQHFIDNCCDFNSTKLFDYACGHASKNIVEQLINKGCNTGSISLRVHSALVFNRCDDLLELLLYLLSKDSNPDEKDIGIYSICLRGVCNGWSLKKCNGYALGGNEKYRDAIINVLLDYISKHNGTDIFDQMKKDIGDYHIMAHARYTNSISTATIHRLGGLIGEPGWCSLM